MARESGGGGVKERGWEGGCTFACVLCLGLGCLGAVIMYDVAAGWARGATFAHQAGGAGNRKKTKIRKPWQLRSISSGRKFVCRQKGGNGQAVGAHGAADA